VPAFKALGHRHRLQIFLRLASCCVPGTACVTDETGRRCVGEVAAALDIAPSTVSHHIKEMIRAGLIVTERHGREIHCRVDPEILRVLGGFFDGFLPGQSRE
jgi:ArsR family transcriptional regulator